mgnify:CR=1 FL=1
MGQYVISLSYIIAVCCSSSVILLAFRVSPVRTVLLALSTFFPTDPKGAIGSLDYPKDERVKLAHASGIWSCPDCKKRNKDFFLAVPASSAAVAVSAEPSENAASTTAGSAAANQANDRDAPASGGESELRNRVTQPAAAGAGRDARVAPPVAAAGQRTRNTRTRNDRMLSVMTILLMIAFLFLLMRRITRRTETELISMAS